MSNLRKAGKEIKIVGAFDFAQSLKQGIDGHKRIAHPDKTKMKVCHICSYQSESQNPC